MILTRWYNIIKAADDWVIFRSNQNATITFRWRHKKGFELLKVKYKYEFIKTVKRGWLDPEGYEVDHKTQDYLERLLNGF